MKLGIALSLWRAANQKSQKQAAEDAGVPLSAYRRFEAGKTIAHDDFMRLLNWMVTP